MTRKILIYGSFVVAGLVVVSLFVTTVTYTQLIFAILLYIPLAYFGFQAFSRKTGKVVFARHPVAAILRSVHIPKEDVGILDIDKRTFFKMLGAAGLSYFLFSIFNKGVSLPSLGGLVPSGKSAVPAEKSESSPTDGYSISEIDDVDAIAYYGYVNKDGAWFIMKEDADTGSFRYTRSDSGFTKNWANREDLKYDYYHNLF